MFRITFSSTTSLINSIAIGMASILLGGCQTTSDSVTNVDDVASNAPEKWSTAAPMLKEEARVPSSASEVPYQWVYRLDDAGLNALIEEALRNNLDLKLAAARKESARQLMRMARANLFPSLGLNAGASISENSGTTFRNVQSDDYGVTLGASWEVDLWGKVRNDSLSGKADFEASEFDLLQARHSLVAAVCSAWYQCIAAKEQLELAQETVVSYTSTADLIETRFESGIDTALDFRLAVASAENAKSALSRRQESFKRSVRVLQMLLGRYPNAELSLADKLPFVKEGVTADIPASVLERRPDLRAAERRLASAMFAARSANRAKLPSINLTGATGLQSEDFSNLLDGNYDFWSAEVSVSQPLFAGGRIDANAERAQAVLDQYRAIYEQVALQAFFEVEQALEADVYFADLEASSREASEQSVEAEKLAWDQYTSGIINIVTVLESQRYALNARQSAIEARSSRIQNRIQLYLALGGDV